MVRQNGILHCVSCTASSSAHACEKPEGLAGGDSVIYVCFIAVAAHPWLCLMLLKAGTLAHKWPRWIDKPICCCNAHQHVGDPFEQLVNSYLDNRSRQLAARLGAGVRSSLSRFTAFVKKHRRTGSHIPEAGSIPGGLAERLCAYTLATDVTCPVHTVLLRMHILQKLAYFLNSSHLARLDLWHRADTQPAPVLRLPRGTGFGGSLMERPEAQRIKQLAAAFASVAVNAGQMRRNFTEGNSLGEHLRLQGLEILGFGFHKARDQLGGCLFWSAISVQHHPVDLPMYSTTLLNEHHPKWWPIRRCCGSL